MNDKNARRYQRALVKSLKQNGYLKTKQVERAFMDVPRHLFLPDEPLDKVYSDIAIMVKKGEEGEWTSSSSQPAIMAIMLEELDLKRGQSVLEIGTGTGYNAALIAAIVGSKGRVVSIDIQPDLVEDARQRLEEAGFDRVETIAGDGGEGWPEGAPYDRMIVTANSAVIPPAWRQQLAPDGRLVMPLSIFGVQKGVTFERRGDTLESVAVFGLGFMPLQGAYTVEGPAPVRLGRDEMVRIEAQRELPVDAERLSAWLIDRGGDWPSGVTLTLHELVSGLLFWISAHEPGIANLVAVGEAADEGMVPPLLGVGGEWKSLNTTALVTPEGMAALMRPPGQDTPFDDIHTLFDNPEPFELYVRQLGPGVEGTQRLIDLIQSWEAAGRPESARLQVRAIPAEAEYSPAPGEFVDDKPWTKFVVRIE